VSGLWSPRSEGPRSRLLAPWTRRRRRRRKRRRKRREEEEEEEVVVVELLKDDALLDVSRVST